MEVCKLAHGLSVSSGAVIKYSDIEKSEACSSYAVERWVCTVAQLPLDTSGSVPGNGVTHSEGVFLRKITAPAWKPLSQMTHDPPTLTAQTPHLPHLSSLHILKHTTLLQVRMEHKGECSRKMGVLML